MDQVVDGARKVKLVKQIFVCLIMSFIGIVFTVFSVFTIIDYNQKNESYQKITAEVVDYESDEDDYDLQAIVVEYQIDGERYRKTANSYSNMPKSLGTKVDIKYNPENPTDIIWVNDSANIIFPLVGGLFTLVGIVGIVSSVKGLKKKDESVSITLDDNLSNAGEIDNPVTLDHSIPQHNSMESVEQKQDVIQEEPELLEDESSLETSTVEQSASLFSMPTPMVEQPVQTPPLVQDFQSEAIMTQPNIQPPPPIIQQDSTLEAIPQLDDLD